MYSVMHVMKNVPHPGEVFWELLPFNREVVHEPEGLLSIWLGHIMVLQMQHESTECKSDAFTMHAGLQQCIGGSALMVSGHYALQKAQDARLLQYLYCSIAAAAFLLLLLWHCC